MSYITGWIIVGIITMGIYKLFELFVGRKERLAIIEKIGDKLDISMLNGKFKLPLSAPTSFLSLRLGSLLAGMGAGLLIGYLIGAITIPDYLGNFYSSGLAALIYGACVLLFGGVGMLIAFVVELKIQKKDK